MPSEPAVYASNRRQSIAACMMCACVVALLAAFNYAGWLSNYFVADDWALIGAISQPDWSPADLLPFRQVPHRINSTFYYSPVYTAILWLAFKLGGFDPERYHLLLLAFHIGTTLLLFASAAQLTRSLLKATAAASIFAVHFANSEAVGWFGAITHPLAGFFGAMALFLYAHYLSTGRSLWWRAALIALLSASLVQVTALPWFAILACLDVFYSKRLGVSTGILRRLAVLVALLAVLMLIQFQVIRVGGSSGYGYQLGPWVIRNAFYYPVSTVVPMLEEPSYSLTLALVLAPVDRDALVQLLGMTDAFNMLLWSGLVLVTVVMLWTRGGILPRFSMIAFALATTPFLLLNGHGYRYLYVPLMFFSLILADVLISLYWQYRPRSLASAVSCIAIVPLFLTLSFCESQRQLYWWQQAGFFAHRTLQQLKEMQPEFPPGAKVVFGGLPDTLQNTNAQVWRNGISEAVTAVYGDPTLRVEAYTREEAEQLFRQELKGAFNTYGFVWEDWQLKRIDL